MGKDILDARKLLVAKAKTYYSNEALNPRPKRGRPPKQAIKLEIEPQVTLDLYTTIPASATPFLFTPEIHPTAQLSVFSSKFGNEEDWLNSRRVQAGDTEASLNQKLASLRALSSRWGDDTGTPSQPKTAAVNFDFDEDDEDEDWEEDEFELKRKSRGGDIAKSKPKSTKSEKAIDNLKGSGAQTKKGMLTSKSVSKGSLSANKNKKIINEKSTHDKKTLKPINAIKPAKPAKPEKPSKPKIKRIMPRHPSGGKTSGIKK